MVLTGKAGSNAFGRDDESNSLTGNEGSNLSRWKGRQTTRLYGGKGKDTLIGGAGDDFADGAREWTRWCSPAARMTQSASTPTAARSCAMKIGRRRRWQRSVHWRRDAEVRRCEEPGYSDAYLGRERRGGQCPERGGRQPERSSAGILAQAQFPGDLPVFYSLVNPGGIFSIDSTTGESPSLGELRFRSYQRCV